MKSQRASKHQGVKKLAGVTHWAKKISGSNTRRSCHALAVWLHRWRQVPRQRRSRLLRTQASFPLCPVNTLSTEPAALSTIVIQSRSATAWRQSLAIAAIKMPALTIASFLKTTTTSQNTRLPHPARCPMRPTIKAIKAVLTNHCKDMHRNFSIVQVFMISLCANVLTLNYNAQDLISQLKTQSLKMMHQASKATLKTLQFRTTRQVSH